MFPETVEHFATHILYYMMVKSHEISSTALYPLYSLLPPIRPLPPFYGHLIPYGPLLPQRPSVLSGALCHPYSTALSLLYALCPLCSPLSP
jgi:hypothetical protein